MRDDAEWQGGRMASDAHDKWSRMEVGRSFLALRCAGSKEVRMNFCKEGSQRVVRNKRTRLGGRGGVTVGPDVKIIQILSTPVLSPKDFAGAPIRSKRAR